MIYPTIQPRIVRYKCGILESSFVLGTNILPPKSVKELKLSELETENILCHVLETILVYEYPTPVIFSALTRLGIVAFLRGKGVTNNIEVRYVLFSRNGNNDAAFKQMVSIWCSNDRLKNLDLWIVGLLKNEPHPSHAGFDQIMDYVKYINPKKTILTHMTALLDEKELISKCPDNVLPAYDGMVIDI